MRFWLMAVVGMYVASAAACPVPGERMHWLADYCMAELQTDDEIAASDCIGEQLEISHENDCAAKIYYKTLMCRTALTRGHIASVERCLADDAYVGSTVRNGGVGGGR